MKSFSISVAVIVVLGLGVYFMMAGSRTETPDDVTSAAPETTAMTATLTTTLGDIVIALDATNAPNTVENFVTLANAGFYEGVKLHRVISGFMIQGGDPLTKDESQQERWGTGGPGYTFEDEIHAENRNVVGALAMANAGPNTNGSQFFINTADNRGLDSRHTVFGTVTAGMDVVRAIEATPTNQADRPLDAVSIIAIAIGEVQ
jgi:cyclophilin family peptidyl-prolyl cis-trans isomerase